MQERIVAGRNGHSAACAEPRCSGELQANSRVQALPRNIALAALYAWPGRGRSLRACPRLDPGQPGTDSSRSLNAEAIAAMHMHRYDDAEAALLRWLVAENPATASARYHLILARRQISGRKLPTC